MNSVETVDVRSVPDNSVTPAFVLHSKFQIIFSKTRTRLSNKNPLSYTEGRHKLPGEN